MAVFTDAVLVSWTLTYVHNLIKSRFCRVFVPMNVAKACLLLVGDRITSAPLMHLSAGLDGEDQSRQVGVNEHMRGSHVLISWVC